MSRTTLCLAIVAALLVAPRSASAIQNPPLYFVCQEAAQGPSKGTVYFSDVMGPIGLELNNRVAMDVLAEEFQKFVADTYKINAPGQCSRHTEEKAAAEYFKQTLATAARTAKVVETYWKHAPTVAATAPAPAPVPKAPKPGRGGLPMYGFCFANVPGMIGYNKARPTYITPVFETPGGNQYGAPLGEYLARKYSIQPWPTAACSSLNIPASEMEPFRQKKMAQAKDQGAPSVIETEWTYDKHQALMAEIAKNAPAQPAPTPAAAAKKPVPDDDAAPPAKPTPAPVTAKPPASAPSPQSPPQGPAMYSYCYAYGNPTQRPTGPVKQHFYITQPFQLAMSDRPNMAFQSFLHDAHPGENISASCSGPVPLDAAQKNRQTVLDLRKKQTATFDVVEVDWKFSK